jgi:hypothetical protein
LKSALHVSGGIRTTSLYKIKILIARAQRAADISAMARARNDGTFENAISLEMLSNFFVSQYEIGPDACTSMYAFASYTRSGEGAAMGAPFFAATFHCWPRMVWQSTVRA